MIRFSMSENPINPTGVVDAALGVSQQVCFSPPHPHPPCLIFPFFRVAGGEYLTELTR